jgi:uncharacterized membrane protein YqhA
MSEFENFSNEIDIKDGEESFQQENLEFEKLKDKLFCLLISIS